jgi:hypothetical protein
VGRHRAGDAACRLVGVHRQAPAVAPVPHVGQQRFDQRELAGFGACVVQDAVHQAGLEHETRRPLRGTEYRLAQPAAAHRRDQHRAPLQHTHELGRDDLVQGRPPRGEDRADRSGAGEAHDLLENAPCHARVDRCELLELVDHHDRTPSGGGGVEFRDEIGAAGGAEVDHRRARRAQPR